MICVYVRRERVEMLSLNTLNHFKCDVNIMLSVFDVEGGCEWKRSPEPSDQSKSGITYCLCLIYSPKMSRFLTLFSSKTATTVCSTLRFRERPEQMNMRLVLRHKLGIKSIFKIAKRNTGLSCKYG